LIHPGIPEHCHGAAGAATWLAGMSSGGDLNQFAPPLLAVIRIGQLAVACCTVEA
jgi:hypothetical protein